MNYKNILNVGKSEKEKDGRKKLLLKIINFSPGIRYRELLRITSLNNGTLSHHLSTLEKCSTIKIIRLQNSNITRYYPASTSNEEAIILGYLKIKTTKEIIIKLLEQKRCTFNELVAHINKAPSTTSWNLKRLLDAEVIIRRRGVEFSEYSLKNPVEVENLLKKTNVTLLDRSIDNYTSLIEDL
ncbi:MAG TPA: ArsR family transcriptional regulator [Candidatus Sulfopaludibacter sp.]|jgi:predicted transcriptional regulator|nr:ArsR family transcriptional regulator [Candidatus Sulfopaludibacter sp.]